MATIGDLQFGTSKAGTVALLEQIKAELIIKVSEAAGDIYEISDACVKNWQGVSRVNFLNNLRSDVKILQDGLNTMYNVLETEIMSASNEIMNFDRNLID